MVGDNISDNNKEKRRKNEEKAKMYREMMKKEENERKQLLRNKLIEEKSLSLEEYEQKIFEIEAEKEQKKDQMLCRMKILRLNIEQNKM